MSRHKRQRSKAARPANRPTRAPAEPRRPRLTRRALYAVVFALVAVLTAGLAVVASRRARRVVTLPAPRETAPATGVRRDEFVGAEACASCHSAQYAAWRTSTHGRAGSAPAPGRVLAAFDGRPLHFRNAVVTPRRSSSGSYEFVIARENEPSRTLSVDGVIGGGHMAGGGTQGFVTRWDDGTYRFLPFDYSRDGQRWFCNTGSRADRGWVPITSALALEDCGDWPPVRALGEVDRFANCQSCHASQLDVSFDTTRHRYETAFATLAINCESCHGPGRAHVRLMSAPATVQSSDIGMRSLATLDKDQSLQVCYQCHAVKDRLRPGYLSGDSLERYYSLSLPLLGDRPLDADGRVRTFAYQENQRYSDCYLNGGLRCTDCHDPHSQHYRDVDGTPLSGRFDDRQCTSCHASKADAAAASAHSHHRAASAGSRCVGCHMPYVQHPEIGGAIRYARSDHTIPIPRPDDDDTIRAVSGCAICHRDRTAATLASQVSAWYGTLKPRNMIIARQRRAEHDTGAAAGLELVSTTVAPHEYSLIRSAGVATAIDRYLGGETTILSGVVLDTLRAAANHDANDDVRALSLAAMHLAGGDDPSIRRTLADVLRAAGAHDAALRDRWALALGYAGDRQVQNGALAGAILAYQRALEIRPDNAPLLRSLANAERDAGALASAMAHYRQSLQLTGDDALTLTNFGIAQAAAGDSLGAVSSWERASALDPNDPLPVFNLANAAVMQSRIPEAIAGYRAALRRDESLVPAALNLARVLAATGAYRDALEWVRRARRFDSTDANGRTLEAQLVELTRRQK